MKLQLPETNYFYRFYFVLCCMCPLIHDTKKKEMKESNAIPTGKVNEEKHRIRAYNDVLDKPALNKIKGNKIESSKHATLPRYFHFLKFVLSFAERGLIHSTVVRFPRSA